MVSNLYLIFYSPGEQNTYFPLALKNLSSKTVILISILMRFGIKYYCQVKLFLKSVCSAKTTVDYMYLKSSAGI